MAYVEKNDLVKIFQDTQNFYGSDAELQASIQKSIDGTKFYNAEDYPPLPAKTFDKTLITVTQGRTFDTAVNLRGKNPSVRIAVHNLIPAAELFTAAERRKNHFAVARRFIPRWIQMKIGGATMTSTVNATTRFTPTLPFSRRTL